MPYELRRHGDEWCVHKQDTGEKVPGGCHASRAEAVQHLRALYANVPDAEKKSMDETLITYGGAVKAMPGGVLGGYLVSYSTPEKPDLEQEFFDGETDYAVEFPGAKSDVYYNHGQDATIGKKRLGAGKADLGQDEVGVWIKHQLDLRSDYERAVYGLAKKNKLSWSSGSLPHLVEREKVGAAYRIKHWPLGLDASVTPTPCNPHGTEVVALKSWSGPSLEELLAEESPVLNGDGMTDEERAAKATYDTASSGRTSYDRVSGAASRHMSAHHAVVLAAGSGSLKHDEAVAGLNRSSTLLEGLCSKKSVELEEFSVKSILAPGMETEEKAERVVAIITGFAQLMDEKHAARVKSGRRLSKATCDSIASVMESLKQLLGNEDEVLPDEPAGPVSEQKSQEEAASAPEAESALVAQYLRFQTERGRELLGHVSGA